MAYLSWNDDLTIGIEVIDRQHKRIVDYINELHDAVSIPGASETQRRVAAVLNDAIDYTESHFSFEEAMLEEVNYEFLHAHKKIHEAFVHKMQKYQERIGRGENIAAELNDTLKLWLIRHIKGEDRAYREWFSQAGKDDGVDLGQFQQRLKSEKKSWFTRLFPR